MDLKSLGYFVAAVETGSITAAAARCYIAQPSISAAIHKLEDELGVALLIRQKRGVSVTEAGHDLFDKAKNLLHHAQSIKNGFAQKNQQQKICIQVSHAIAFEYLNQLMMLLREDNPLLQIKLMHPKKDDLSEDKEIDIRLTMEQAVKADEEFIPGWSDRYCLIIPNNHPLAHLDKIAVTDLNNMAFINRSFCDRSQAMTDFLQEHNIHLNYMAHVENEEWALSLVESGLGLSIVPLPSAVNESPRFKVIPIGNIEGLQAFERRIGVAINYAQYTQPYYQQLALTLKSRFSQ